MGVSAIKIKNVRRYSSDVNYSPDYLKLQLEECKAYSTEDREM